MLQIVRWLLIGIIFLLALAFALANQGQTVSVRFLKWQSDILPLYIYLYLAFAAGLLSGLVITALGAMKLKRDVHRLNRENHKIQQELDRMRNVSIDEDADDADMTTENQVTSVDK